MAMRSWSRICDLAQNEYFKQGVRFLQDLDSIQQTSNCVNQIKLITYVFRSVTFTSLTVLYSSLKVFSPNPNTSFLQKAHAEHAFDHKGTIL